MEKGLYFPPVPGIMYPNGFSFPIFPNSCDRLGRGGKAESLGESASGQRADTGQRRRCRESRRPMHGSGGESKIAALLQPARCSGQPLDELFGRMEKRKDHAQAGRVHRVLRSGDLSGPVSAAGEASSARGGSFLCRGLPRPAAAGTWRKRVLLVGTGLALALGWNWLYSYAVRAPLAALSGSEGTASMTLLEYAVPTDYGAKVTVKLEGVPLGKVVCYGGRTCWTWEPGQTVAGTGEISGFRPASGRIPLPTSPLRECSCWPTSGETRPSTVRDPPARHGVARPCGPGHAEPGDGAV